MPFGTRSPEVGRTEPGRPSGSTFAWKATCGLSDLGTSRIERAVTTLELSVLLQPPRQRMDLGGLTAMRRAASEGRRPGSARRSSRSWARRSPRPARRDVVERPRWRLARPDALFGPSPASRASRAPRRRSRSSMSGSSSCRRSRTSPFARSRRSCSAISDLPSRRGLFSWSPTTGSIAILRTSAQTAMERGSSRPRRNPLGPSGSPRSIPIAHRFARAPSRRFEDFRGDRSP